MCSIHSSECVRKRHFVGALARMHWILVGYPIYFLLFNFSYLNMHPLSRSQGQDFTWIPSVGLFTTLSHHMHLMIIDCLFAYAHQFIFQFLMFSFSTIQTGYTNVTHDEPGTCLLMMWELMCACGELKTGDGDLFPSLWNF